MTYSCAQLQINVPELQIESTSILWNGSAGHGGDGFLKFQDAEEVSNIELADAFEQMWQKRRCIGVRFKFDPSATMYTWKQ